MFPFFKLNTFLSLNKSLSLLRISSSVKILLSKSFLLFGDLTVFARRAPLNYRLQGGVVAGGQPVSVNSRTSSEVKQSRACARWSETERAKGKHNHVRIPNKNIELRNKNIRIPNIIEQKKRGISPPLLNLLILRSLASRGSQLQEEGCAGQLPEA